MKESKKQHIEEFYAKIKELEKKYSLQLVYDADLDKTLIYSDSEKELTCVAYLNKLKNVLEFVDD